MGDARSLAQAHSSGRIYKKHISFSYYHSERSEAGFEESQFISLLAPVLELLRCFDFAQHDRIAFAYQRLTRTP